MSHDLIITKAFILKSFDVDEASRMLNLYTEKLGLVSARAQGVRLHKSKMRYSLQPLTLTYVSLIRGREFFRIVNSQEPEDFSTVFKNKKARELVARAFTLMSRLINGEEPNQKLFDHVYKTFSFIKHKELTGSQLDNLEVIVALNIMNILGYLPEGERLKTFVSFGEWSESLIEDISTIRNEAVFAIKRSFDESQL